MYTVSKLKWVWRGALIISTAAFAFITGCQKEDSAKGHTEMVRQAKLWYAESFGQNKFSTSLKITERMKAVARLLNWNEATEYLSNNKRYVITPFASKISKPIIKNYDTHRSAVFFYDNAARLHMKIVELISARGESLGTKPQETILKAFLEGYSETTSQFIASGGSIIFYNENYMPEKSFSISNGKLLENHCSTNTLALKNKKDRLSTPAGIPSSSASASDDSWETWYLVFYVYDISTGEILSADIINSWQQCTGTCDSWGPADDLGGTGTGSNTDLCLNETIQNLNELIENSTESSELVHNDATDIDKLTKYRSLDWICLKNLTWVLHSHETGIIKLVDPATDKWQWESLTHVNITKEGTSFGGTAEPSNGIGTPSFTPGTKNVLYAGMNLSFQVTYTPAGNCPGLNITFPATTTNYEANCFFSAKP